MILPRLQFGLCVFPPESPNGDFIRRFDKSSTVISLLSATSSCPSRNSHICLTIGGHSPASCSWHSRALGSETATCFSLALDGMPSIPTVFRPRSRSFFHCLVPSPCWWNSCSSDPCFETTGWLSIGLISGECPLSPD